MILRKFPLSIVLILLNWSAWCNDDLAAANAKADSIHSNGKTALMVAAKNGDSERIVQLIQKGADVNKTNNNGGTPIMYAALSGNVETVSLLIRHNANVNALARNGWTALMIASVKGHVDIARMLLHHGAEPNQADVYSWTPLMRSVYENRTGIARLLLESGLIDVNQPGENGVTALHLAVLKGNEDIVNLLLAGGADPHVADHSGRTALDYARKNNNLRIESLIRTGLGN